MRRAHRLEAVTVCIGYADFLHESAKWNASHFDEWIIVTDPKDHETREVCRKLNLKCLLSEDGHRHGNGFNKGRLVARGLQHTSADSWRLHIDADIVLPQGTRHLLQTADLHEDFIYGADRFDVPNWDSWLRLQRETGFLHHSLDYHCRLTTSPPGYKMGARWAHPQFGYCPIGFFQLWHASQDEWRGIRVKTYSHAHNTACRTDVQFALLWDRHKRGLVPELVTAHLMSENARNGANWQGRTTKPFGPALRRGPGEVCG